MRITIPTDFNFNRNGAIDFDKALSLFTWESSDSIIEVDFGSCHGANYQTLSLLVPFLMRMRALGKRIEFFYSGNRQGATTMWKKMGAGGLISVLFDENDNFRAGRYKPLFALRTNADFAQILSKVSVFTNDFTIQYEKTLRYVLTEIFYNALEHGRAYETHGFRSLQIPPIVQFSFYDERNEISFIVTDLGVGIKKHIEQSYPGQESDEEAIRLALQPHTSGTFAAQRSSPYSQIDNAGMGLYLSSNIVRRLHSDMYIVSGSAAAHISPTDVTTKKLNHSWPGTFVYITIRLNRQIDIPFEQLLQSFRSSANEEAAKLNTAERQERLYISIFNHFGSYAEDKEKAIRFRNERLLPALEAGKTVVLDFDNVDSCPHSFINALLATPIKRLGLTAFKQIKAINKTTDIDGVIQYIFDEHT